MSQKSHHTKETSDHITSPEISTKLKKEIIPILHNHMPKRTPDWLEF